MNNKNRYIIISLLSIIFLLVYKHNKTKDNDKKEIVDKKIYCNYDLNERYIKNDSLIRNGVGLKVINVTNYIKETVSEYGIKEYIFTLKDNKKETFLN